MEPTPAIAVALWCWFWFVALAALAWRWYVAHGSFRFRIQHILLATVAAAGLFLLPPRLGPAGMAMLCYCVAVSLCVAIAYAAHLKLTFEMTPFELSVLACTLFAIHFLLW
jgi:hypothetical protein